MILNTYERIGSSGSEATHFSVMYRDTITYSIAHPALQPQIEYFNKKIFQHLNFGIYWTGLW
jgi:glutathionyl-hydroquinone reductase